GREELLRLLTIWSHQPHLTVTQTAGICGKDDLRAVRRNRPCRSLVPNFVRRSSQGRDRPDAGLLLDGGVGKKTRPVRKPGPNPPFRSSAFQRLWLRYRAHLPGRDKLQVNSFYIPVRQVFTVRRNRAVCHGVLTGVGRELLLLQLALGKRSVNLESHDERCDQQSGDCQGCRQGNLPRPFPR